MYHHSSPPRGWPAYDYTSPPTSPYYQSFYVSSPYANASPRNPTKRHSRKSSYASPRESGWYSSHVHHRESLPQEYYSSRKHDNAPPPFYEEDVKRSRARRASTSTRTTPPKPKFTVPPPKSHRKATEDDAAKAGIAKGYCIRYWDPTEAPIILLGSVFDANSLGKWIYDWTVYCYNGGSAPMADVAGELWLLLIRLAGKVKRADECLDRVRNRDDRETLKDFLKSGARLRKRFKTLLERCEHFMLKAAERESRRGAPVSMGSNAGCEFVKSIFGRDRYLQDTEELMASMRLWDMRFDVNCESILQPSRTSSRRQSTV